MTLLQNPPEIAQAVKASSHTHGNEDKRAILEGLLPMLIVLGLWLFAQAWLMGPLMFR